MPRANTLFPIITNNIYSIILARNNHIHSGIRESYIHLYFILFAQAGNRHFNKRCPGYSVRRGYTSQWRNYFYSYIRTFRQALVIMTIDKKMRKSVYDQCIMQLKKMALKWRKGWNCLHCNLSVFHQRLLTNCFSLTVGVSCILRAMGVVFCIHEPYI